MHELIRLLTEFGADDDLIALATRFVAPGDGIEPLTDDELATLDAGLVAFADEDAASAALLREAADVVVLVRDEAHVRIEAAEAEDAAVEAERARLRGETAEATDTPAESAPEGGDGEGGETEDEGAAGSTDDEVTDADEAAATIAASAAQPAARRALRAGAPRRATTRPDDEPRTRIRFLADASGRQTGSEAASLRDVDRALFDTFKAFRLSRGGQPMQQRIAVAQIEGNYPEDRRLIDAAGNPLTAEAARRVADDTIRSGLAQPVQVNALTAAAGGICAGAQPIYTVETLGDDRRPVRDDAMVNFLAGRGQVISIAPPTIADLDGSVGAWTIADDEEAADSENPDDPDNPKNLLWVTCGDPRTTAIEGIYRRLGFRNIASRTFPEWDAAFTDLSMTWQARFAERRLLAAIKSGSINTAVETTHVSATRDLLNLLNRSASNERIHHRLPANYPFRVILPEQLRDIMREDISKSFPGGSYVENLNLADATIASFFATRNLNPTWSPDLIDVSEQTAGVGVYAWPTEVEVAMYPEGTWLHLDDGTIDLGVVRDTATAAANTFQTFAETFEGAHKLGVFSLWHTVTVCPSGATNGTLDPAPECASYT
jgi:hypothetical protein